MRSFPPLPDVRDSRAPDGLFDGHLWLLELIDGRGLRFRMEESGLLRFGDPDAEYADPDAVPLDIRPAVRHVRERFDREALRDAVDDPETVVFFGVATGHRGTDYDWGRLPPFLGTDVWIGSADGSGSGSFRPPDAAASIFDGVGLDPINAIEREVNARDFDPDAYAVPDSAWRDGPAAGVVVRNKRGGRGTLPAERAATGAEGDAPAFDDAAAVATSHATDERFERVVAALDRQGEAATVDAVADRVVESIARETPVRFGGGGGSADPDRVRDAVVDRTRAFLDGR